MICTNEIAPVAVKNCIKVIRKCLYYSSRILIRVVWEGERGCLGISFYPGDFDLYSITPTLTTRLPWIRLNTLQLFMGCGIWFLLCWMWGERKRLENKKSSSTTLFLLKVWKVPRDYVASQQTLMYNHTCIWLLKMVLFLVISSAWICLKTQTK